MSQDAFVEMKADLSQSESSNHGIEKAHMSDRNDSYAKLPSPVQIEEVSKSESLEREYNYDNLLWTRIRRELRAPFAEFFGVFIMILFGDGSVAQVLLSNGVKGQYQSISWGYARSEIFYLIHNISLLTRCSLLVGVLV